MAIERRRAERKRTEMFVNKFIDGMPHTARLVELSAAGCVLERILEPATTQELYPLEVAMPPSLGGERLWLWARPVWSGPSRVGMRFVGTDATDRAALARFAAALS